MNRTNSHYTRYCVYLVLCFAGFRMLVMGRTGLGDSESYYWCWSQRLDLSYYDHPPLVAWLIRLFTDMGGDTSFFVRMPSALLFLVFGWLFYRLSMELFDDERVAFWSILTFNLIPVFGIGALQMVPDIPSAACYLAFVLVINRLLTNNGPEWLWYVLGLLLGLGMLGKYFMILVVPSAMLLVALVPEYRHWYRRKGPYLMGFIALLVFLPVLAWNFQNDWPSFKFHLTKRHEGVAFEPKNFIQLIAGQLLYISPVILIGLLWGAFSGAKRAIIDGDRRYALLACFSIPTLLFFYVICAWTNESEPHWPTFGYLTAIVMTASLGLDGYYRWAPAKFRRFWWSVIGGLGLAAALFVAFYIHVFHPILPIKAKYDIINELYGWDRVGASLERESSRLDGAGIKNFGLAQHWVLCSQMMFSTGDRIPVACYNGRDDQFDFWDNEQDFMGATALVVTDNRFTDPPDKIYNFDSVKLIDKISIVRGGVTVRTFKIWQANNYGGLK